MSTYRDYTVKRSKQTPSDSLVNNEKSSILYWTAMFMLSIIMFVMPFQKALFNGYTLNFEKPIYIFNLLCAVILLLVAIFMFYYWKVENRKDLIALLIWLVPISYAISIINAASHHYANSLTFINISYAILFITTYLFAKNKLGANLIQTGIYLAGYLVVIFGYLNLFGNFNYQDAVYVDANGGRLTSVFQYANTYAGFTIAVTFAALFLVLRSKNTVSMLAHSLMLVPSLTAFFLTLSRGGFVVLPVVLLLILPFLSLFRQMVLIVYLVITTVVTFIFLGKITAYGGIGETVRKQFTVASSVEAWAVLVLASLIGAGLIYLFHRFVVTKLESKWNERFQSPLARFILPTGAIIIGAIGAFLLLSNSSIVKVLLPESIEKRVENINFQQHSVLERATFYKDAVKIIKDHPVLGAGGGAWAAFYEKYQNNPYISRQAHNYLLQYIVDVGFVGFTLLLLLLVLIFYFFIRSYVKGSDEIRERYFIFYIVLIALIVHSLIDFDMSYVYLGGLLFICLGGMLAASAKNNSNEEPKQELAVGKIAKVVPTVLLLIAVFAIVISLRNISSNNSFNVASNILNEQKPYTEALAKLDQAIKIQPDHPEYNLLKINLLSQVFTQTKDEKFYSIATDQINTLLKYDPYNRQLLEATYNLQLKKEKFDDALQTMNKGIENFPWEITMYERAIGLNVQQGDAARIAQKASVQDSYWKKALDLYQTVQSKMKYLETLPKEQAQGRPFNVTPSISQAIGQLYYVKGDYKSANEVLGKNLNEQMPDEPSKALVRWYAATQKKLGNADLTWYNKLIAKDPAEAQKVEQIVQSKF